MWKKNGIPFAQPLRTADAVIYNPTVDQLIAAGYRWVEPAPPPEPQPQTVFTKLSIRRAMRSLGIEERLDALLAVSPTFAADWNDAQEIDLADPVLVEALAAGSITPEEVEAIRAAAGGGAA